MESDLSEKARSEIEFLKDLKKKSLSCSDIINAEGDPVKLERLLDLRSFYGLRKKKEAVKSGSQSQAYQAPDTPRSTSTPIAPASKHSRTGENSDAISGHILTDPGVLHNPKIL
ncbi:hypothetical protein SESBI_34254 [Sesbania bispinosa]|nr:hypothetical protein SESBI_34254 [Sesbania bispinosa]